MTRTIAAGVVAVVLLAAPAFAHDVDGKWNGIVSTPMGDIPVAFEFKADGATLNGTSSAPDGSTLQIKDGKIDGQTITFVMSIDAGGVPLDLNYKGDVTAAEIKFTLEIFGMPFEFVVKKAQ
jgi:opacity protein-like surface antigen